MNAARKEVPPGYAAGRGADARPGADPQTGAGGVWFVDTEHRLRPQARQVASPNFDDRADPADVSLIVIHAIALPPETFGGPFIDELFTNRLDPGAHPYFETIRSLRVSAHLCIFRDGACTQYVSFDRRAWHAGVSSFSGRERCNDFSIGIELEGSDTQAYVPVQYETLAKAVRALLERYPTLSAERIVGHSDISPGRKTDPGNCFDWARLRGAL